MIKSFAANKLIAAICAAPMAIRAAAIHLGKHITSHPSIKEELVPHYTYSETSPVVLDANLITSRGPGTSIAFALAIVGYLSGPLQQERLAQQLLQ